MKIGTIKSEYSEVFQPELEELDAQSTKNEQLYDEVHKSLEKSIERIDGAKMFGTTSPHRDISETGKVLADIRSNQVAIIKEKSNVKKTIIDLELRRQNLKTQAQDSDTNQALMKNILLEFNRKMPTATVVTPTERKDKRGMESLQKLMPDQLGVNENDYKMIDKFRGKKDR